MAISDPLAAMHEKLNALHAQLQATTEKCADLSSSLDRVSAHVSALEKGIQATVTKTEELIQKLAAQEKQEPLGELLKTLASATVVLAIPVYAAGWGFLYRYYKSFGLNISDLDLPLYETMVFSLRVFFDSPISVFFVLVGFLVVAGVLSAAPARRLLTAPGGLVVFLLLLLLSSFWLSRWGMDVGRELASKDMMEDSPTLPLVAILVDAEAFQKDAQDYLKFDKSEFKLLLYTNGRYFFFRPVKSDTSTNVSFQSRKVEVFAIPDDRVRVVRILRGV